MRLHRMSGMGWLLLAQFACMSALGFDDLDTPQQAGINGQDGPSVVQCRGTQQHVDLAALHALRPAEIIEPRRLHMGGRDHIQLSTMNLH
jgi:hypothetical protein